MSAAILAFPEEAIYRRPPTLENTQLPRDRRALIDALSIEEQMNVEAQLARDLFAVIMGRNSYSLRPSSHPRVSCPDFGEPLELEEVKGYKWGRVEAQHLFYLKRARRQLDWLIGRIERKQARAKAKKREG